MANGVRYHPSARQVTPFEKRNLWPPEEEEERLPGSTYDPVLGSTSPINYEALGLINSPLLGPPLDTDFKSNISMPSGTPLRNSLAGATSVDDIYNAIFKAEHRSTRKKPWIKTKVRGGSAWGEVQITDGTMETAMNSSSVNLTPEEFQYARRYIGIPSKDKAQWLTGPYEKEMYRTIAKKIMDY